MIKRLFSLLLAAALAISLLPAVVMATETPPQFVSQNMTLENIPVINFYVAHNKSPENAGYTIEVTIGGVVYDGLITPEEYTAGIWVYRVPVKAKQLLKTVEVKLVKDGEAVDEGTFQLETYYNKYSALENKDEKMVALLEALINYGMYAEYFNVYGTADPAVEKINSLGEDIAAAYAHSKNSDLPISAMLVLKEACTLRIAIPVANWHTGYSLKINGEIVAPKAKTLEGYMVYDIAEILPQNWDRVYKIQVLDPSDAVICTMNASVMSYANRVLNLAGEEYAKLQSLMKAMFAYYRAADECVGIEVKYADAFTSVGRWVDASNKVIANANTEVTSPYAKVNADGKLEIAANGTTTLMSAVLPLANTGVGVVKEGVVAFEFDVTSSALGSYNASLVGNSLYFAIMGNGSENNKTAIDVQFYANGIVCFDGVNRSAYPCVHNANETYRIKIVANMDATPKSYNVYVDGVLAIKEFPMRSQTLTQLEKLRLWTANKLTATMTYDNLVISQLKSMPADNTDPIITEVYSDTFTDKGKWQALGGSLTGWTSLDSNKIAGNETTGCVQINNNNQLRIKNVANTSGAMSAKLQLSKPLSGLVGIEFNVAYSELASGNGLMFNVLSESTVAVDIRLFPDKISYYTTASKDVTGVTYQENETYRVKIIANTDTDQCSFYIDNVRVLDNVPMRNDVTSLNVVRLFSTDKTKTATSVYDNLEIYQLPESADTVIYVDAAAAVGGNGTKEMPFDTIQAAVKTAKNGDVVYIREGEYYVDEPIALTSAQNGITLEAASVAGVRIYGATKVTGWTEGENGIWSVPYTGEVPHTLYEGDTRAIKARYPNREYDAEFITSAAGYLLTTDTDEKNQNRILVDPSDWNDFDFSNITDANIVIWPWNDCDWAKYTVKIESIDQKTGTITPNYTTDSGAPYGLNARYYIEGMLELLDAPGEFYYDSTAQMLYYKPLYGSDPNETDIYAPVTNEIFTVTDAKNITFKGLSLEKTNFLQTMKIWYNHTETRKGAVTMCGSSNIIFQNCRFKNTGLHGIYITSNGKNNADNNVIDGCLFENMGISGVILESNVRADASRMVGNKVTNCLMHDLGELAVDCAGVNIWSTQNTAIENCEFYNSPRYAVSIRGGCYCPEEGTPNSVPDSGKSKGNIVKNCLIYYTNQDSGDAGALHTAGINYLDSERNTNYFENIYIDHILPHATMKDYAPNGYFGDYFSNYQSFENIRVTNCFGAVNSNRTDAFTNLTQIRFNDTDSNTGTYKNTSWTLGFQNANMDYTKMGLTTVYPLELLPDVDSIRKSVILKIGSKAALDNGALITLSTQVAGDKIPVDDIAKAVGATVAKGKISLNGKVYETSETTISAQEFADGLGLNLLETDGLLIFSQEENLFDTVRDSLTLKRLGNLLFENYQAQYFKYEVIESVYGDYTAVGTQLKEGEYYMLRSSASKNAAVYAVGKRNGQIVYVVREDNYSVPALRVLDTVGNEVNFSKSGNTLTITVDDIQIAQINNPFEAVFLGTYTKTGTNTLAVNKNGLSIAPNEPSSLNIRLPKTEIGINEQIRYAVTLIDVNGKEYDLTNEEMTITVTDGTVAEAKAGYILPKKIGKTTMTIAVTVNGTKYTESVEISVVRFSSILFSDSFDADTLSSASWAVSDLQGDSYVKINSKHQLEIHGGQDNNKTVFAKSKFPESSGKVVLEFDFTPNFGLFSGGDSNLAYLLDSNGNYSVSTFCAYKMLYTGVFAYYDGATGEVVQTSKTCRSGTTYHIRLVANTDADTFDFYVDGTQIVKGVAFRNQAETLSGVMFSVNSSDTTHCWDNVSVKLDYVPDPYDGLATTLVYEDVFDNMGEWSSVSSNAGADASANYAKVNDGKLEIKDDANCRVSAVLKLSQNLTGLVGLEFDITSSELRTDSGVYITIWGNSSVGNDKLAMDVRIFSDKIDCYTTQSNLTEGSYKASRTYHVKLVADVEANTYSVIIDGELVAKDIAMRNGTISCLNKIRLWSTSDALSATVIYDNLEIYQITQ